MNLFSKGKRRTTDTVVKEISSEEPANGQLTNECSTAIAMAIHLYYDEGIHDIERTVLTIKRPETIYSPWNSKIYGITNLVR
jgi:hypothetical protein